MRIGVIGATGNIGQRVDALEPRAEPRITVCCRSVSTADYETNAET